jgi:hypothetical protein
VSGTAVAASEKERARTLVQEAAPIVERAKLLLERETAIAAREAKKRAISG